MSPMRNKTTTTTTQYKLKDEEACLVIFVLAHPDDESMFFIPTIYALQQQQRQQLWLLCLTNGNYDGLGRIRSQELHRTAQQVLGLDKVLLLCPDDDRIQDHPRQRWDVVYVARRIESMIQVELQKLKTSTNREQISCFAKIQIITFDHVGVSGHVNHRDTYEACRYLCRTTESQKTSVTTMPQALQQKQQEQPITGLPPLELWTLVSDTTPLRYLPILAWLYLLLTWLGVVPKSSSLRRHEQQCPRSNNHGTEKIITVIHRLQYPWLNWRAMASHASQFVWYRRLFVVFSSYTYVNRLKRRNETCKEA